MIVEVFKQTKDNWCGNYITDGGLLQLVQVSFMGNIETACAMPVYRVCVWGNDDCGMEFDSECETEAWNKFLQVVGLEYVDRKELKALGFVSA